MIRNNPQPCSPYLFPKARARVILFLVIFVGVSTSEAFSAALFSEQAANPQIATSSEQTSEPTTRKTEGDDQRDRGKQSSNTLLEAITRKRGEADSDEPTEPHRLDPDRPHLPEASTAVGKGRIILEGGYTFNERMPSSFSSHDAPEAVFRVGIFADWFEVRIGQNFLSQERSISGVKSKSAGIQDLYLGAKVALNKQRRYLPEVALIPQMTIPTAGRDVTAGRVLPGVNVDGNWEIIKNRYSIEFVVANNRIADDAHHSHFELATGVTHAFQATRKLEVFGEWDVFKGSIDPGAAARHYAVGGLVFFATKNFAVDFRAGAGLNAQANDFLIGAGFAVRH